MLRVWLGCCHQGTELCHGSVHGEVSLRFLPLRVPAVNAQLYKDLLCLSFGNQALSVLLLPQRSLCLSVWPQLGCRAPSVGRAKDTVQDEGSDLPAALLL